LEAFTGVMEAARAAGTLHSDITQLDLRVILCGVSLQLIRTAERYTQAWRHFGDMVIRTFSV
jgi:hypothetical protein